MTVADLIERIGERFDDPDPVRLVAASVGVGEPTVRRWMEGGLDTAQTRHLSTLFALADAAGIPVDLHVLVPPDLSFVNHLRGAA